MEQTDMSHKCYVHPTRQHVFKQDQILHATIHLYTRSSAPNIANPCNPTNIEELTPPATQLADSPGPNSPPQCTDIESSSFKLHMDSKHVQRTYRA